uniref:Uncharacterized protein n=1 Tax=Moniliophthora roreri TaxID=221103 RepID=A0A0W0G1G0_MONRR
MFLNFTTMCVLYELVIQV